MSTYDFERSSRLFSDAWRSFKVAACLNRKKRGEPPAENDEEHIEYDLELLSSIERCLEGCLASAFGKRDTKVGIVEWRGIERYGEFREAMGRMRVPKDIREYVNRIKAYKECLERTFRKMNTQAAEETEKFFSTYGIICYEKLCPVLPVV